MSPLRPEDLLGTIQSLLNSSGGIQSQFQVSFVFSLQVNLFDYLTGIHVCSTHEKVQQEACFTDHLCQHPQLNLTRAAGEISDRGWMGASFLLVRDLRHCDALL